MCEWAKNEFFGSAKRLVAPAQIAQVPQADTSVPIRFDDSRIAGIPCQIRVLNFTPYVPMRITGSGYGDADPPENEELDYQVLDRKGYKAYWLEKKMTDTDEERIYRDFHLQVDGERYGYL